MPDVQTRTPTEGVVPPRAVPRCTVCGYIGVFKKPPVMYKRDLVITVVLLFAFGAGLIWGTISLLKKKYPSCPNCKTVGRFTYVY